MSGKLAAYSVAGFFFCALFFHQWKSQGLELPGILVTMVAFIAAGSCQERKSAC